MMQEVTYGKKYINPEDPKARYKQAVMLSDVFLMVSRIVKHVSTPILLNMGDDNVYRIDVQGNGRIEVLCFGIESIDTELEGYYDSLQDLPKWVQERIALLSMLKHEPPTEEVEGVGRRINVSTYWVYKPNK